MDLIWILCCNLMSCFRLYECVLSGRYWCTENPQRVCEMTLHDIKISVLELLFNVWGTVGLL